MGVAVVTGATIKCAFGSAPQALNASSQAKVITGGKPIATVADVTVPPFGMCSSLANPAVASATAAALGVLTPQPCTFAPAGVWSSGKSVMLCGKPVLTSEATIMCGVGAGVVSITMPGQSNIIV